MKILICSDGTEQADHAVSLGARLAAGSQATVTLLGVAESPEDRATLDAALARSRAELAQAGVAADVVSESGPPIRQIVARTLAAAYDLVVIGARSTHGKVYARSAKVYEIIKAVSPPVLVVTSGCQRIGRILVCTGGKKYIDAGVALTAKLARGVGASVTLLHVMAQPPGIFARLPGMGRDARALLEGGSELGRNLSAERDSLQKSGVPVEVCVREGIALEELFREFRERDYDLIVTGSSLARGPVRHYIMGDLTREILNGAPCPVLVTRPAASPEAGGWLARAWAAVRRA